MAHNSEVYIIHSDSNHVKVKQQNTFYFKTLPIGQPSQERFIYFKILTLLIMIFLQREGRVVVSL